VPSRKKEGERDVCNARWDVVVNTVFLFVCSFCVFGLGGGKKRFSSPHASSVRVGNVVYSAKRTSPLLLALQSLPLSLAFFPAFGLQLISCGCGGICVRAYIFLFVAGDGGDRSPRVEMHCYCAGGRVLCTVFFLQILFASIFSLL
jgi:hypothetical protein